MNEFELEQIKQYGGFELLARQVVEGFITGLHKSPYHGFSVEFAEHRLYNSGESTRHIDWKVYGRTDRLYTKRYEEETNLRCMLAIDNSSSMHYNGKIEFALMAAASLAYLLQRQRDAVGACLFDDQIRHITHIKATAAHLQQLFALFQQTQTEKHRNRGTAMIESLHSLAEQIHRRCLVIIFSDMFDSDNQSQLLSALQHLRHKGHEVIFFHVFDHSTELMLELEDRPTLFIDLETGQQIKANPAELRENYQKAMQEKFKNLSLACSSMKVDFMPSNVNEGFHAIMQAFLVKRKRMK
jgi:uncharacterized protein (DUF58 family)